MMTNNYIDFVNIESCDLSCSCFNSQPTRKMSVSSDTNEYEISTEHPYQTATLIALKENPGAKTFADAWKDSENFKFKTIDGIKLIAIGKASAVEKNALNERYDAYYAVEPRNYTSVNTGPYINRRGIETFLLKSIELQSVDSNVESTFILKSFSVTKAKPNRKVFLIIGTTE